SNGFYLGYVWSVFSAQTTAYNNLVTNNKETAIGFGVTATSDVSSLSNPSRLYSKVENKYATSTGVRHTGTSGKTLGAFVDTEQGAITSIGGSTIGVTTPAGAEIYNFKTTPMYF